MTIVSPPPAPARSSLLDGKGLWCSGCRSDDYVFIESIGPFKPPDPHIVEVTYTCIECDSFYANAASVTKVAAILHSSRGQPGVLHFDGEHIHCGASMETTRTGPYSAGSPVRSGEPTEAGRGMKMLRCRCGFTIAIPAQ